MLNQIKPRKGQTLVEVMVALTVLTVALTSTFVLIISALNLVIEAQNRTEAIEIAQKGISEGRMLVRTSCQLDTVDSNSDLPKIYTTVGGKTLSVTMDYPTEAPFDVRKKRVFIPDYFRKFIATVEWTDKWGNLQSVSMSQTVRIDGE